MLVVSFDHPLFGKTCECITRTFAVGHALGSQYHRARKLWACERSHAVPELRPGCLYKPTTADCIAVPQDPRPAGWIRDTQLGERFARDELLRRGLRLQ